jgi:hypothetical protein
MIHCFVLIYYLNVKRHLDTNLRNRIVKQLLQHLGMCIYAYFCGNIFMPLFKVKFSRNFYSPEVLWFTQLSFKYEIRETLDQTS